MSYLGNVLYGGETHLVGSTLYGTCTTPANTAEKKVTCSNFDQLLDGVTIHVKFTYSNTASSPTLNVNNTGAKAIYNYGSSSPTVSSGTSWQEQAIVSFTYDGTYWIRNDFTSDTTYNVMTSEEALAGNSTTARTISAAVLNESIENKFSYLYDDSTNTLTIPYF